MTAANDEPRRETPLAERHRLARQAQALAAGVKRRPADGLLFDDADALAEIGRR